jgi:hypothetical protein
VKKSKKKYKNIKKKKKIAQNDINEEFPLKTFQLT